MASEPPERHPVPVALPPSLDEWLEDRAAEAGVDQEELLVQLAATYRVAVEDGGATAELVTAVEEAATDAATERVDHRLGSFRSSLDSQLQAIRKRIVQLKQESDEKAEASRVHELTVQVDDIEGSVSGIEASLERVREEVEEFSTDAAEEGDQADASDGTEPSSDLVERLDDVESKLVRVARAIVELRDDEAGSLDDATFHELKRVAAREGLHEATCTGCEERVDLSLLAERVCPHCECRFRELSVDSTLGEPRLTVEDGDGDESVASDASSRGGTDRPAEPKAGGTIDES